MDIPDMSVQVRPPIASYVTISVRTIVSQQQYSIFKNLQLFELDAQIVVRSCKVCIYEIVEPLFWVVCEHYCVCICLYFTQQCL